MSSYNESNTFGPDWLRNKPVFSKHRWGQEELLGLSQNVGGCPKSLLECEDLATSAPLPPVNYTQFTEEEKELLERPVSERGRGRGRGSSRGGGTRRGYDSSYSRRDDNRDHSRSADCDNWRRRDPDPPRDDPQSHSITTHSNSSIPPSSRPTDNVPEPGFLSRSPPNAGYNSVDPPYYPPFPPKTTASSLPPTYPPFPPSATTPTTKPNIEHTESDSWRRDDNAILRNISQNLDSTATTPDFQPPFSSPSQDMAPGNISSQIPQSSGPSLDIFIPREPPSSPQQNFPSLRDLGATQPPAITSMSPTPPTQQTEVRGQGFLPPPAPPTPEEDIEHKWFYLDPKKNTQGPFDSVMMFNWFSQGYFGMNLEIRRDDDTEFKKLEDVIRDSGKIPFQPDDASPRPPISSSTAQPPRPDSAAADTRTNVWDTTPSQSIWGTAEPEFPVTSTYPTVTSSYPASSTGSAIPSLSPGFPAIGGHDFMKLPQDEAKRAQRADDMRQEIERAMAAEQQRKQKEEDEENRKLRLQTEQQRQLNETRVLEQQRVMHAKRHEDSLKEAELSRLKEIEVTEKKRLEEEADMLRVQKERLDQERHLQEERNRVLREEAEKERKEMEERRQIMEKERLKLEREKELIRQQEEELKRREVEKAKHEEVLKERARVAEERSAAIQAAAEAKAIVEAQAAAERAAAEKRAAVQRDADDRAKAEAEKKKAAEAASKKSVWGAVNNTSNTSGPSPWATQATPVPQMTSSATRTPTPNSGKVWVKPAPPKGPSLSEIQKSESQMREHTPKYPKAQDVSRLQGTWANTASRGNQPRSLADIQKEQESYLEHQENLNYARLNQWNPVAGMLEEDHPKPKTKQQPTKPHVQQQQQKKGKSQQNNRHNPALMEMFNNSPRDEFTVWCEKQVMLFRNPHIDVPTFISFLRDVESPIEVREYVINFLGDTKATDEFVKDFVIKRKSMNSTIDAAFGFSNLEVSKPKKVEPQITSSKKHKKKKMQKVNAASLLGINCTASSDARNRGDIDNVIIQ